MKPYSNGKVLFRIRSEQCILDEMGHQSLTRFLDFFGLAVYVHTYLPEPPEFVSEDVKRSLQDACDCRDASAFNSE